MKRLVVLLSLLIVGVPGCYAGKSTLITPGEGSLSGYQVIELAAVRNDTGEPFTFDIGAYLREQLMQALKERRYRIHDSAQAGDRVLLLTASIVAYQPGSALQRWLHTGGIYALDSSVYTVV